MSTYESPDNAEADFNNAVTMLLGALFPDVIDGPHRIPLFSTRLRLTQHLIEYVHQAVVDRNRGPVPAWAVQPIAPHGATVSRLRALPQGSQ